MDNENPDGKLPDAVLAVIMQLILSVSLATSAVPPTVLSVQDRASETMGVFIVIIMTAAISVPIRLIYGLRDLSSSEYVLAVLAPLVTRLDLGLMIWTNINKALLWVEQMLYATREQMDSVSLLILASRVWHNGENRIFDPEFGFYGGEAAMQMYRLQKDYDPRSARSNLLALTGHITLWPFAVIFHVILQILANVGFVVFWVLALAALPTRSRKSHRHLKLRGSFLGFVLRRKSVFQQKLFMRKEVAAVFDSRQYLIRSNMRHARHKWAMLASVDAIIRHEHFKKLFSIAYPMRAPQVYKRTLSDDVALDMTTLLNQESILFGAYADNPLSGIGEEASRQVILYRLLGWPKHTDYSASCLQRLTDFAESNMQAWKETEERTEEQKVVYGEFISIRDILRRNLVQLVMLAFFDGLGECLLDKSVNNVSDDLTRNFMKGRLPGIEMAVRLCNIESGWNDDQQTSSMILSLRGNLDACSCRMCEEMDKQRRLTNERYQSRPSADEVGEELSRAGCDRGKSIESIWKVAVRQWIVTIFEP